MMDGAATIKLSQGKVAIVDEDDFDWLNQWKWYARKDGNTWYASRTIKRGERRASINMQRVVVGLEFGDARMVDHLDSNGLNNRRSNLRICTHKQNCWNSFRKLPTSGFRGVNWYRPTQKWVCKINIDGKAVHLGYFDSPEKAAEVYDLTVVRLRGEFAVTNSQLGAYRV